MLATRMRAQEGLVLARFLLVLLSRGSLVVLQHFLAAMGSVLAGDLQGLDDLLHHHASDAARGLSA